MPATDTLTISPVLDRIARTVALCDRLEEIDSDLYDDLREYAEADPEGYAALYVEAAALGHVFDDDQSAYGNACDIRFADQKKTFLGVERTITLGLAPQVDLVLTCSSTGDRWYSAVLSDYSNLSRQTTTALTDEQVTLILTHYDIDLSMVD